VCSAGEKTVPFNLATPQDVDVRVSVHNASASCLAQDLRFNVQVQQIDPFNDATNLQWLGIFGNGPGVSLPPLSSHSDQLRVTLPAGAPKGERCFRVTISPAFGTAFPAVECIVKIVVGDVICVEELNGNQCGPAGTLQTKSFAVTNLTAVLRTVNFTASSTQTSSGTASAGDHFPLAFCGQPLPPGNPADQIPPSVPGSINLAPNQTQVVCIDTMSYPMCMPGSNCQMELAATDMATGCVARAGSATTVTPAGWTKNNGTLIPPASATVYNGSGLNPLCLSSSGPPFLGSPWTMEVTGTPNNIHFVLGYDNFGAIPTQFGELLVLGNSLLTLVAFSNVIGVSTMNVNIPLNPALLGRTGFFQGGYRDVVSPGGLVLCNALQATIGN